MKPRNNELSNNKATMIGTVNLSTHDSTSISGTGMNSTEPALKYTTNSKDKNVIDTEVLANDGFSATAAEEIDPTTTTTNTSSATTVCPMFHPSQLSSTPALLSPSNSTNPGIKITELPTELTMAIMETLPLADYYTCTEVCPYWHDVTYQLHWTKQCKSGHYANMHSDERDQVKAWGRKVWSDIAVHLKHWSKDIEEKTWILTQRLDAEEAAIKASRDAEERVVAEQRSDL